MSDPAPLEERGGPEGEVGLMPEREQEIRERFMRARERGERWGDHAYLLGEIDRLRTSPQQASPEGTEPDFQELARATACSFGIPFCHRRENGTILRHNTTCDARTIVLASALHGAYTAGAHPSAPPGGLRAVLEALQRAAEVFRHYEKIHRGKQTKEGYEKANANRLEAEACEAALSAPREPLGDEGGIDAD